MSITPPSAQYYYRAPRSRLMPILLALLLTAAVGTILLWSVLRYGIPFAPQHSVTLSKSPSTPQSRVTSVASPAPSTTASVVSPYPVMATSYGGTVVDLLTNEKTSMFLMQVQQNKGSISGYFQGLGLVGPFKGKVTTTGHVQFKVQVQASGTTLSFDGDIKIGGDIVGSFQVLDQHGQRTGESGAWNVAFYS